MVVEVQVNNTVLATRPASEDGCEVILDAAVLDGSNTLVFRTESEQPFVWIEGAFSVRSESPFASGPNGTIQAEGPFSLGGLETDDARNAPQELIAAGFSFARGPLVVEGNWESETVGCGHSLRLAGIKADAARVRVDGRDLGWAYGPDWQLPFVESLPAGAHRIQLGLIPSTFNFFGPHHHVDGDRHLVSPDQFSGKKNFADRADAPDPTQISAWHFKPLRPPTEIALVKLD